MSPWPYVSLVAFAILVTGISYESARVKTLRHQELKTIEAVCGNDLTNDPTRALVCYNMVNSSFLHATFR